MFYKPREHDCQENWKINTSTLERTFVAAFNGRESAEIDDFQNPWRFSDNTHKRLSIDSTRGWELIQSVNLVLKKQKKLVFHISLDNLRCIPEICFYLTEL